MNRPLLSALLTWVLGGAATLLGAAPGAALEPAALEKTVVAVAAGTVGAGDAASESVVFGGQASISGKVIYDTVFGAPPVLEIIVDLGSVTGKGLRTGRAYVVSGQAILHRPLVAFDPIEVGFAFSADGDVLLARSATASFDVYYSAAQGMTTTPVRIATRLPG